MHRNLILYTAHNQCIRVNLHPTPIPYKLTIYQNHVLSLKINSNILLFTYKHWSMLNSDVYHCQYTRKCEKYLWVWQIFHFLVLAASARPISFLLASFCTYGWLLAKFCTKIEVFFRAWTKIIFFWWILWKFLFYLLGFR